MVFPFFKQEETKVICLKCEKPISLKITPEYTSELCLCGCTIWYPPNPKRKYSIRTFISREEYLKNKSKENQQIETYKNVSKVGRTLGNPK